MTSAPEGSPATEPSAAALPSPVSFASLGTSLRHPAVAWVVAALVLAYDLATLARDFTPYDAPELALAASQLGLSHPIGQPLHTLLAAPFAHLPGVAPLTGLALFSALFHALLVLPASALAEQLGGGQQRRDAWVRSGLVGALLLAPPIWECATRVEVYTLSSFALVWAMSHAASITRGPISARETAALGLALGLTASANAYHAALATLALTPLGLGLVAAKRVRASAFGALLVGIAVGLLPYAYVPIVGGRTDVLVWGAPTDAGSLWDYFRGADYARNRGTPLAQMLDHLLAWLPWSATSGVLVCLTLGGIAHVQLGRAHALGPWTCPVLALGTVALLCSHAVFHVDIVDYQNYLTPALVVGASGTAAWVAALARERPLPAAGLAVAALVAALVPTPAVWARARARDHGLGLAARGALAEAPPGAVIVVGSDHWVAPLLYLQEVERLRPDVVVVAQGLASSSWFWALVARRHPDLPPFDLVGPGGREGRIRRLLDASPDRAVLVEDAATGATLGREPCDVGHLVRVQPCEPGLEPDLVSEELGQALDAIGRGSPGSDEALTAIALARGDALWRLGRTREAMQAFASGVPPWLDAPAPSPDDRAAVAAVPALHGWHEWLAPAAIADPRRALFLQAMAYGAAGRPIGRAMWARAAELGLPEATLSPPP